jgi:WD40 repeat protein
MRIKNSMILISLFLTNALMNMQISTITPPPTWSLEKAFEHHNWVNVVCLNKTKTLLGVSSGSTCAYITDFTSGEKIIFFDFKHGVTSLCFNEAGTKLAILTHKPEASIFDITKGINNGFIYTKSDSFAYTGAITSIYFNNENTLLGLKSDANYEVHITDLKSNINITSYNPNHWVTKTAISPLKKLLATGSGNNKARLFDAKHKKELTSFDLQSPVKVLAFNDDETLLAAASGKNIIHIFNVITYKEISTIQYDQPILSMCFGQNILVVGSIDGKIHVFKHKI